MDPPGNSPIAFFRGANYSLDELKVFAREICSPLTRSLLFTVTGANTGRSVKFFYIIIRFVSIYLSSPPSPFSPGQFNLTELNGEIT